MESYTQDREAQRDILTQILVVMIFPIGLVVLFVLGLDLPEGVLGGQGASEQALKSIYEPEARRQVSSMAWEKMKSQVEEVQRHIPILRTPRDRQQEQLADSPTPEPEEERHIPLLRTPRYSQEEEEQKDA